MKRKIMSIIMLTAMLGMLCLGCAERHHTPPPPPASGTPPPPPAPPSR